MNSLPVTLDVFDGPLDLLLYLVEKNKVEIYDIPIAEITDQYIEYIKLMQENQMEVMSDFLVMAAVLLKIKSAMLLPKPEDDSEVPEDDPRMELANRLMEYKMYKFAAASLRDMSVEASKRLYRSENLPPEVEGYKEPVKAEDVIGNTTLELLTQIFNDVIKRNANRLDPIRSNFGKIQKEEVNFTEKVMKIQEYGLAHKKCSFRKLLEDSHNKVEVIVTFLGILELIKMGRVEIVQEDTFSEIEVTFLADDVVAVEAYL